MGVVSDNNYLDVWSASVQFSQAVIELLFALGYEIATVVEYKQEVILSNPLDNVFQD